MSNCIRSIDGKHVSIGRSKEQLQTALVHSANYEFISNEVGAGDKQIEGTTSLLPQRTLYYNVTAFICQTKTSTTYTYPEQDEVDFLTRQLMGDTTAKTTNRACVRGILVAK